MVTREVIRAMNIRHVPWIEEGGAPNAATKVMLNWTLLRWTAGRPSIPDATFAATSHPRP